MPSRRHFSPKGGRLCVLTSEHVKGACMHKSGGAAGTTTEMRVSEGCSATYARTSSAKRCPHLSMPSKVLRSRRTVPQPCGTGGCACYLSEWQAA